MFNVLDFGASGNGSLDDYEAIKAAVLAATVAGGGQVFFPRGVYCVGLHDRYCGLLLDNNVPIIFRGEGAGVSVLKMMATPYSGDYSLLRVTGDVALLDLGFDGDQAVLQNTAEQTHLVHVEASKNFRAVGCRFGNVKGDGIKVVGASDLAYADNLHIEANDFADCGRSGVTCQRAFRSAKILGNHFVRVSDQSIDFEPSGASGPQRVVIANNIINHGTETQAVTICGVSGTDPLIDVLFTGNIVNQGSVFMVETKNVTIQGNRIAARPGHIGISASRLHTGLSITGNNISTTGASAIALFTANGRRPEGVLVANNTMNVAGGVGVSFEGVSGVVFTGNRIVDVSNSGLVGINIRSTYDPLPVSDVLITNNQIIGFDRGIYVSSYPGLTSDVAVVGNQFAHKTKVGMVGVYVQSSGGKPVTRVTVANNHCGQGVDKPVVGLNVSGAGLSTVGSAP